MAGRGGPRSWLLLASNSCWIICSVFLSCSPLSVVTVISEAGGGDFCATSGDCISGLFSAGVAELGRDEDWSAKGKVWPEISSLADGRNWLVNSLGCRKR